jgi:hypothetical protein
VGLTLAPLPAAEPAFSERTTEVGIDVVFLPGTGYSNTSYSGGGAVGDFNRDGFQDLFVLDGDGIDHLYINNGDGTFTDQAVAWGLTASHRGKGASVADYNKDGWTDLYVTSAGSTGSIGACKHKLYRNNGDGSFTDVAAAAGVQCTHPVAEDGWGSTFGDYDLDGDLDLFVAGFTASNGGSKLFRNNGNGTFTNVTTASSLFFGVPQTYAFTPRFVDTDEDDYPELLLVADFGTSRYYRNNGNGTFTELGNGSGTTLEENGMGGMVGDFNRDGRIDWYVTSIYNPPSAWTGNKLYLNQGGHSFLEVSQTAGVYDGGYGWGAVGVDFNHDAHQDIAETNGATNAPYFNEPSYLWKNNGNGTYTEMAQSAGLVHFDKGRGMANLDFDNDGDQDVVIFANNDPVRFYRNDLAGPATHWLRVFLDTQAVPALAAGGIGSRVWATTGILRQFRYVTSGDNFLSHSELSAHFGLGGAGLVDLLEVHWPNGQNASVAQVDVDRSVTLVAHDGTCSPAPPAVEGLRLAKIGGEIRFTWTDGPADDYVVLADSAPTGGFHLLMGAASSGLAGVVSPMPSANRYFLVYGRQSGCIGP